MVDSLQTQFSDREALSYYLQEQFPLAVRNGSAISPIPGGREAAEGRLRQIEPLHYAATRNMLTGTITRLSPYLRHGVLSLAEVRRHLLMQFPAQKHYKLLQELAWRDYYQRVYKRLKDDIWQDIEPYKTGVDRYTEQLPDDIEQGTTGLTCIDAFSHDLRTYGYLHNHARLWTAAYVIHHRHIRWQAGAYWFLQHLLDGDVASNNLSWQWVASTFSSKPYYFNRDNLAHYSENAYCSHCPLLHNGCPFEGAYEEIADRIFPKSAESNVYEPVQTELYNRLISQQINDEERSYDTETSPQNVIVWLNDECLNPHGPAITAYPQAQPIFIFDDNTLTRSSWSLKRIAFIYECLLEIPGIQICKGSTPEILTSLTTQQDKALTLATTAVVSPVLQRLIDEIKAHIPIRLYEIELFVKISAIKDLRRFSHYWKQIEKAVIQDKQGT